MRGMLIFLLVTFVPQHSFAVDYWGIIKSGMQECTYPREIGEFEPYKEFSQYLAEICDQKAQETVTKVKEISVADKPIAYASKNHNGIIEIKKYDRVSQGFPIQVHYGGITQRRHFTLGLGTVLLRGDVQGNASLSYLRSGKADFLLLMNMDAAKSLYKYFPDDRFFDFDMAYRETFIIDGVRFIRQDTLSEFKVYSEEGDLFHYSNYILDLSKSKVCRNDMSFYSQISEKFLKHPYWKRVHVDGRNSFMTSSTLNRDVGAVAFFCKEWLGKLF